MKSDDLWKILEQIGIQNLRESGNGWINGLCPFHSETRPSWGISNEEPHFFNCFGCKAKGPLRQLLIDVGGMSATLADQISAKPGPIRSRDLFLEVDARPPRELDASELYPFYQTIDSKVYLRRRGIKSQTWIDLGIVFDPSINRILFPWLLRVREKKAFNVKLFGVTGRTILENEPLKTLPMYGTMKGQSLYLPNRRISKRIPFVIVEGEIDAAIVYQAETKNVGATGFGSFTEQQSKQVLASASEVISFTDDDEAGELLYLQILKKVGHLLPVSRVRYDHVVSDHKRFQKKLDPAELWKLSNGPALVSAVIRMAERNSDFPTI